MRTGASRFTFPCSTRRIIIVAANVFEMDAIGNTVCSVTGNRSSTFVIPSPLVVTCPLSTIPMATPGTLNSRILASASAVMVSNPLVGHRRRRLRADRRETRQHDRHGSCEGEGFHLSPAPKTFSNSYGAVTSS